MGITAFFLSGEGLACEFEGDGTVFVGSFELGRRNRVYAFTASFGSELGKGTVLLIGSIFLYYARFGSLLALDALKKYASSP